LFLLHTRESKRQHPSGKLWTGFCEHLFEVVVSCVVVDVIDRGPMLSAEGPGSMGRDR
jgi:hypothetical protein